MDRVLDFKPLEKVVLPDIGELGLSGLVLVVGPNSSGKSQLLQDLYQCLVGEPRHLVVAKTVRLRSPPPLEQVLACLEREGLLRMTRDASGAEQIQPVLPYLGTGVAPNRIASSQARGQWGSFNPDPAALRSKSEFLAYFGRMFVTPLFLDRRLSAVNHVGAFDHEEGVPQNDLQALHLNARAKSALQSEARATFSKWIWLDASRHGRLSLKVHDGPTCPSADERLDPEAMTKYRSIDTEGDGLRSYLGICLALLLGRRPVCIIDEPEMCLHPPQAYNLGRLIGRHGVADDRVTFVATHSSQVLRGVLQETEALQVLRLTRERSVFHAKLLNAKQLRDVVARPSARAEAVLDGVFAQGVAVVEADSDRIVYQAAYEALGPEFGLDVHFTAVGGVGGIAETCRLYRGLDIATAVIADLDVLGDVERLMRIARALAGEACDTDIRSLASAVAQRVRDLPPTMLPPEVSRRVSALRVPSAWEGDLDQALSRELRSLGRELDRMRRLKGGVAVLPQELRQDVNTLMQRLEAIGLFLVPGGELEGWLSGHDLRASKEDKWEWAMEAAIKLRSAKSEEGDIWGFVRRVGRYLWRDQ